MEALISRTNSSIFDVLVVVALDSKEPLGTDLVSDLVQFRSLGLNVGIMPLMQTGNEKRYRNAPVIQAAFDLQIPICGGKDACLSSIAIVYSPELYLARAVLGSFSATTLAFVLDGNGPAEWNDNAVGKLLANSEELAQSRVLLLAASLGLYAQLVDVGRNVDVMLWNFHYHSRPQPDVSEFVHEQLWIGAPDPTGNRHGIYSLRNFSRTLTEDSQKRLALRAPVPGALQTGREEPDFVLGFPFVPSDRDAYYRSLQAYVLPRESLSGATWRQEIFDCMAANVHNILLPCELEPYFGSSALYYEDSFVDLLNEIDLQATLPPAVLDVRRELLAERDARHIAETFESVGLECATLQGEPREEQPGWRGQLVKRKVRAPSNPDRPRIVFVTSNGAGMGHLTRLLAVARRLDPDIAVSFISMSQACGVVAAYGFDFEYIGSKGDLSVQGPEWNTYFNRRFGAALDRIRPDVVVFDGTWPYQGISKAVEAFDARFVWMRRGMWRKDTPTTSLIRNSNFDWVITPGEVGAQYDLGATTRATDALMVQPIVVMDPDEILTREQAREALGIQPDQLAALVTLGAGNINAIDKDVEQIVSAVQHLPDPWRLFMTSPMIAEQSSMTGGIETLSIYPLARYARAFDFVVSATGYNSFHEWIAYGVPTLWIANENTITDDQIGRAVFADEAGIGIAAGPGVDRSVEDAVIMLGDSAIREEIRVRLLDYTFINGAIEAASHLNEIARGKVR